MCTVVHKIVYDMLRARVKLHEILCTAVHKIVMTSS